MIKNYIFDFGNVITHFHPEELVAPYIEGENERKLVSEVAFDREYWKRLDDGTISDDEVVADIRKRLPEKLSDGGVRAFEDWIVNLRPVDGMCELILDIKKNPDAKIFLLSNISIRFSMEYERVEWIREIFSLFDGLVLSGPLGITKPNAEIYNYVLEKYSLFAEECIFIDDTEANIQGSERVGIKGYLFDGDAKKLRAYLGL